MRILNVDENHENIYLIETLFRGHGHEVVSATNGKEALAAAAGSSFDVIITDLLMPGMDGFQLISALRKCPGQKAVPIVVYTATYTDAKDETLARSLGADRFLVKPAEAVDLLKAVDEVVKDRCATLARSGGEATFLDDDAVVLKEYNSRLIAKLEKKMLDLEAANRALAADVEQRKRAEAERLRLEEQLRHAQKMEAIGTLAGGIAHDFNNILTAILCSAELGLSEAGRPSGATRDYFASILSAGSRARDLVKQILAFSRQQQVERRPLDLRPQVKEAIRFLRSTIPSVVEIETELAPDLSTVLADPTQVHQIIANLCTNAWHALDGRHTPRISVLLQDVECSPAQAAAHPELRPVRYVCLSVKDNGCGMDTATQARIFDPFFTTKPPGVGTGLGLSVVHGIMRSYDGTITVESELGKGSCFRLYFPVLEMLPSAPKAPSTEMPRGRGQRIVFVDDEAILTKLGERLLRLLGYEPMPFTDPCKAIEVFREEGADALLVDYSMPGLNGVEFAKRVRAIRPEAALVLMTGYSATLESHACTKHFQGVLLKPYSLDSLSRVLSKVLN